MTSIKMKCEDLQLNLPLYLDDILTANEQSVLDGHLAQCPLCRQKLADFQELRNGLRSFERPQISRAVLRSTTDAVRAELRAGNRKTIFSDDTREWLQMRVMPFGVGAFASLLLGFSLLWFLLSAASKSGPTVVSGGRDSGVLLANVNPPAYANNLDLTALEYAHTRLDISGESPSLNPKGALVALTKSLVRGNMRDDEVVVVADVFGNGLAQIAEVVEPSQNRRAVGELEKALESDPAFAPFVPANMDGRSEAVRVILKIQSVDVSTRLKPRKRKAS